MSLKQSLVLVICRSSIDPRLIPPLKIILPMLYNLMPIRIFTSDNHEIIPKNIGTSQIMSKSLLLYEQLVYHLQNVQQQCDLTKTLENILRDYVPERNKLIIEEPGIKSIVNFSLQQDYSINEATNKQRYANKDFRVCLLGSQNVSWSVVMQYKRHGIIIDTAGTIDNNQRLVQISYITGGIHKTITEKKMVKIFLCDFQMDTTSRKLCVDTQNQTVQFTLQCFECKGKIIKQDFYTCSVCLAAYCMDKHEKMKKCSRCTHYFD